MRATGLLDAPADPAFDRVARLAARLLDAPVALVSLVDEDRQFLMSCPGLASPWAERRETPLSRSFCQHVVDRRAPLVVPDARQEPLVAREPRHPRGRRRGLPRGSVAVRHRPPPAALDARPGPHGRGLAATVVAEIELRAAAA